MRFSRIKHLLIVLGLSGIYCKNSLILFWLLHICDILLFLLGCKIKALRAKTNTYIKTPVRGEEPVFIITGRPEDVAAAKREVQAAAEHFTQIRASRKNSTSSNSTSNSLPRGVTLSPPFGSPNDEHHITIRVRVPYQVVGLVVGPKGATVKRIQQITNTYIVTPSRDKEPCFEVSGTPDNVDAAKREIESYIAMRTGTSITDSEDSDYQSLVSPDLLPSQSFNLTAKAKSATFGGKSNSLFSSDVFKKGSLDSAITNTITSTTWSNGAISNPLFSRSASVSEADFVSSTDTMAFPGITYSYSTSPLTSDPADVEISDIMDALQLNGDVDVFAMDSPGSSVESSSSEGTSVMMRRQGKVCAMCGVEEVVCALVPCGHNMFCFECAADLASKKASCPICDAQVIGKLRIYSD